MLMHAHSFRTSKRATLSFVDTFERTLADAISIDADGSPRPDGSPSLSDTVASPSLSSNGFGRTSAPGTPTTTSTKRTDVTPRATKLDVLSEESDGETGDIASSPLQPAMASPRARLPAPITPTTSTRLTRVRAAHAKRMSMPAIAVPAPMQTPEEEEWAKW